MQDIERASAQRGLRRANWPMFVVAGLIVLAALAALLFVTAGPPIGPAHVEGDASRFATLGNNVDDVALTDSNGRAVRWGDLKGKPRAVFFGFTRCPEICPTTVADLSAAIETLGPQGRDLRVDFVSVDPARDTPDLLGAYFSNFGPQFRGYTGDRREIDRLVASYHAFYEHVPTQDGDYTVNHTAYVYLLDANGKVVDLMGYQSPPDRAVAQLRNLVK
jgi:protein SCO1/2